MLRIIGGKYRHLKIEAPNVTSTRPTTDRVREGLMSALGPYLVDKDVLDLFAGSGALGLESLSRGARSATFVDANINAINTVKLNIKNIKIEEETKIYFGKYKDFLNENKDKKYGVVYLDPPYKMKEVYDEIVDFLFDNDMLTDDAVIIKECDVDFSDDERFLKEKHINMESFTLMYIGGNKMKIAMYPGSFDPLTNGHLDIITRASKLFDKVYVCVSVNPKKTYYFNVEEKISMCKIACKNLKNVEIVYTDGLVVKKAKELKCSALIRGLRAVSDFEYEVQLATTNEFIDKSIETVFLLASEGKGFISSSSVKELYKNRVDISRLVPPIVVDYFKKK